MASSRDRDYVREMLVVYDGECAFCLRSVEAITRRDRDGLFRYISRQTPGLEEQYPQLASEDFNTGIWLIDSTGHST